MNDFDVLLPPLTSGEDVFIDHMAKKVPLIFPPLCPRVYRGADGWCSPRLPAALLSVECFAVQHSYIYGERPDMARLMLANVAGRLVELKVPTFHVDRDILAAVERTAPPPDIQWRDIRLPHDAGVFLFPTDSIKTTDGRAWKWAAWCRVKHGQFVTQPGLGARLGPVMSLDGSDIMIFTTGGFRPDGSHDGLLLRSSTMNTIESPASYQWENGTVEESIDSDEREILARMTLTIANLFLAMSVRPELVAPAGSRERVMDRGQVRYEWTPNWVGRGYRIQRADGGGTHNSPRLHWRRGHFRQQPCGPGGKERKTIWLEPTLVGGDSAADGE
jgi:hypothetical protein